MKLALGTVQFGLDYGVTNQSGKVEESEIENILGFAKSNSIDILDTASGYGNSEQVLGSVGVDGYQIITKTTSLKHGVDEVIRGFYQSLKYLNQKSVDGLLIHDINEVNDKEFDDLFPYNIKRLNKFSCSKRYLKQFMDLIGYYSGNFV